MSRREHPERPRKRPKTELQLYREQMREAALERREKWLERGEALVRRRRELRAAAHEESLAEASDALERANQLERAPRVEYQDPDRAGVWSGLAVGLGVAALVGMAGVVVYLLVRKKDGQVVGMQTVQGLGYAPPIIINGGGMTAELAGPLQALAASIGPPRVPGQWTGSLVKSYLLPSLNDKRKGAIRVAQATDVPYEVSIRTVQPTGEYAAFSLSPNELNQASGTPIGDNLILPAGHWQLMTLQPREVLYAKGSNAAVVISVTMNQAATRR